MIDAPDGHTYCTADEAAAELGVKAETVRRWERLEYLKRVPDTTHYRWTDVLTAERTARTKALETSGSLKRVRRAA